MLKKRAFLLWCVLSSEISLSYAMQEHAEVIVEPTPVLKRTKSLPFIPIAVIAQQEPEALRPRSTLQHNLETESEETPESAGKKLVRLCRNCHLADSRLLGDAGKWLIDSYLSKDADLSICDRQGSALMWLSFFGHRPFYDRLLTAGASLSVTSELKYTALHAAAQRNNLSIVQDIIQHKRLPIDLQAACGSTALHLAVQAGATEVVNFLLAEGADPHVTDSLDRTPLHLAVWDNKDALCLALLMKESNPNARMKKGLTPLHIAMFRRSLGCMHFLIMHGADETLLTENGRSLADCVSETKFKKQLLTYLGYFLEQRDKERVVIIL